MTLRALLLNAEDAGVKLETSPEGKLRWRCAGQPPVDLLRQLAEHKAGLLELLARPRCPGCRRPLDEKNRCWKCQYRPCESCGRDTTSAFIAVCLSCEFKAPAPNRGGQS